MTLSEGQLLKFRLLANGVAISPEAAAAWTELFRGPVTLAEYATTSGVALVLPDDLYVNAPLSTTTSVPLLRYKGGVFVLLDAQREVPVSPIPVPSFHQSVQQDRLDETQQPYTNYGVTHTDRCRVSPISGCAWKCHFCDLPYEFAYRKRHRGNMLETIRAAAKDPLAPARHVLISGGTPRAPVPTRPGREGSDDEVWLDDVYAYLAEHSPLPVDVMMPPRRDLTHPAWLRSVGVNMVSINLEISDPDRARALAPAKSRLGRGHVLRYIEEAVEAFGVGFVQSLVVFGTAIEPLESTLRGVRDLAQRGCIPVLSPFRPHHLTPLGSAPAATLDEVLRVYERSLEICAAAGTGVWPGPRCIPCHHNTAAVPDGSDFYVGLDGDLTDRRCLVS